MKFLREDARGSVLPRHGKCRGNPEAAFGNRQRTAGAEPAAGGRIDRAWHFSNDDRRRALPFGDGVNFGHGSEHILRIDDGGSGEAANAAIEEACRCGRCAVHRLAGGARDDVLRVQDAAAQAGVAEVDHRIGGDRGDRRDGGIGFAIGQSSADNGNRLAVEVAAIDHDADRLHAERAAGLERRGCRALYGVVGELAGFDLKASHVLCGEVGDVGADGG